MTRFSWYNLLAIAIYSFYWPLAQFNGSGTGLGDSILLPFQTGLIIFVSYTVIFLLINLFPQPLRAKALAFFMVFIFTLPTYSIAMKISFIYYPFWMFYYLALALLFAYAFFNEKFILSAFSKAGVIFSVLIAFFIVDYSLHNLKRVHIKNITMPGSIENSTNKKMPDIYYIIPDSYASINYLEKYYGYKNQEFSDYLKERNFYHAENSAANYGQTLISLASSLNFDYIENLIDIHQNNENSMDKRPFRKLISQSALAGILASHGYTFYEASSGYVTISEDDKIVCNHVSQYNITEGSLHAFFSHTWIPKLIAFVFGQDPLFAFHQNSINDIVDCIKELSQIESEHPKFVFAHIITPHQPFLNTPELENIYKILPYNFSLSTIGYESFLENIYNIDQKSAVEMLQSGYIDNVNHVNDELMAAIDTILLEAKKTRRPLIIIVQGDHGIAFRRKYSTRLDALRFPILNAYYFSDGNYNGLYAGISPVNSFRVILNNYFDYNLPLLDDKSFHSLYSSPYLFKEVINESSPSND